VKSLTIDDYQSPGAFQAGVNENEIVLLLDSPGVEEVESASPLSGPVFLNFECIRSVIALSNKYSLAKSLSKDLIRIINVWPFPLDEDGRENLIEEIDQGRRESEVDLIASMIGEKSAVLCSGKLACVAYDRIRRRNGNSARTVVFAPYFGDRGLGCLSVGGNADERNKIVLKLEIIGTFLAHCLLQEGNFGWRDMKQIWQKKTGESILWNWKEDGPWWM